MQRPVKENCDVSISGWLDVHDEADSLDFKPNNVKCVSISEHSKFLPPFRFPPKKIT